MSPIFPPACRIHLFLPAPRHTCSNMDKFSRAHCLGQVQLLSIYTPINVGAVFPTPSPDSGVNELPCHYSRCRLFLRIFPPHRALPQTPHQVLFSHPLPSYFQPLNRKEQKNEMQPDSKRQKECCYVVLLTHALSFR